SGAVYSMNSKPSVPTGLCEAFICRASSNWHAQHKGRDVTEGNLGFPLFVHRTAATGEHRPERPLGLKKLFYPIHPRFSARVMALGIGAADRLEFLQQFFLARRQVDGRLDDD